MSRIHEAIKRAEQERAASQTGQGSEQHTDHAVASSVIEPAPPPSSILPHLHAAHVEAKPVSGPVQFDALWAKCSHGDWKPDPNLIVFENTDPLILGAEQFRTLRSRLYRMRESQPLQTILIS